MSIGVEERAERYKQREREADDFGRLITVRRLRPSELGKLTGLIPDVTGFDEYVRDDGTIGQIDRRNPYMVAAMVCQIDEHHFSFPRDRRELDSNYDLLDAEGLTAASKAAARILRVGAVEDPKAEAKN